MRLDILEMFRKQAQLDPTIVNRVSESTPMHQGGKEGRGVSNTGKPAFPAALKRKSQAIRLSYLPRHQLDPRPDLKDDHRLWMTVLAKAWMMDEQGAGARTSGARGQMPKGPAQGAPSTTAGQQSNHLPGHPFHGTLHGLRCGGARLRKLRNKSGQEFLRLVYKPLLGPGRWQEGELVKDWLEPYKEAMKMCFERALDLYERCKDQDGQSDGQLDSQSEADPGSTKAETAEGMQAARPADPLQASLF